MFLFLIAGMRQAGNVGRAGPVVLACPAFVLSLWPVEAAAVARAVVSAWEWAT